MYKKEQKAKKDLQAGSATVRTVNSGKAACLLSGVSARTGTFT
jgi:hypothetical protein